MKYFEMFAGIGGFRYGIEQATRNCGSRVSSQIQLQKDRNSRGNSGGKSNQSTISRDDSCIGYSEIDKYAAAIYCYHYPETRNFGDAIATDVRELLDFTLLVAGFPCQAFSIAGKRKGFEDTRGTLFFEIARILNAKRPRYFLLENVKNMVGHDDGETFNTILRVLTDVGYELQWQVFNSKDFGVPQNRERVFIIGHIRGECRPEVFPIGENVKEDTITNRERGAEIFPTIRATHYKSGDNQPVILSRPHGYNKGGEKELPCLRGSSMEQNEFVKTRQSIRRLTPTECERLQAFPDNWTKYGILDGKQVEISDTQRYKCLGNAVTTNVVQVIIEKLLKSCG